MTRLRLVARQVIVAQLSKGPNPMTEVSYFFSQKENHITNNTLLMLRHVYQAALQNQQLVLRALMMRSWISV